MHMLKAEYTVRGPVPQDVIHAVPFTPAPLLNGQALVAVLAAPINPSDVLTLTGAYGMLPPLPATGGGEGVGRVVALGPDTAGPAVGTTVLLPAGSGTWASHQVADVRRLVPLPAGADPLQLAMLTVNPPTASLMLSEFVTLAAGDWVIQNTANSGVGGYLVQLAKLRGLKTINVVRRESAVAAVKAQGADVVLVDGDDLHEHVKAVLNGAPLRLGIDAVGGQGTNRIARCLSEGGTVVNYGSMSGEASVVSAQSFIFNSITLRGFWLVKWFQKSSRAEQQALYGQLTGLIASGQLRANIQATYSVDRIQEAIVAATTGERDGKILVVPAA
jgi:mitochondrial enoyl-[acyl-carrier protein] reductase / trans-2-enoyl-CoA reductase